MKRFSRDASWNDLMFVHLSPTSFFRVRAVAPGKTRRKPVDDFKMLRARSILLVADISGGLSSTVATVLESCVSLHAASAFAPSQVAPQRRSTVYASRGPRHFAADIRRPAGDAGAVG